MLSVDGFDVRLVARGRESAASIAEFDPDVVLLDMNLPDMSGLDVYEQIHERWPKLRVIFSTGAADRETLKEVSQRKVPWITKPYEMNELLAVLATLPPAP